jgi:broad specificity phosphatase PhoE
VNSVPESLVALLRHGETEGGARFCGSTDVPLTPLGWRQMRAAAGGEPWRRIVASPLRRCADFARELAVELNLPLELDERLREMHFGAWEGHSAAELMAADAEALARFWRDPAANPPPGAEPLDEFQARVLAAWGALRQTPCQGQVLVISHGGVMRTILSDVLGHPLENLLELEIEIVHGSLHRVRLRGAASELLDGKPR